jgi:acetate kinase
MRVLVFNAGSSSLKFALFDTAPDAQSHSPLPRLRGTFDRFGPEGCDLALSGPETTRSRAPHPDIAAAIAAVPALLADRGLSGIDAIGHRMVHGGTDFDRAVRLTPQIVARVERLTPLAPLHNPANLAALRLAQGVWPDLPQVAVFDTAFHLTAPPRATTYAIPAEWRAAGLRRYGFHGTSHRSVAAQAARVMGRPLSELSLVTLHLGNGASACAVAGGQSRDTSMGMTPLEGLVMGTRPGDLDPGATDYLARELGLDAAEITRRLHRDSGLMGLCGASDLRDIQSRADAGDPDAELALEVYAYRVRKYVGAYAAAMGALDGIVFTGGVGENAPRIRARVCAGLGVVGVRLDPDLNAALRPAPGSAARIEAAGSAVAIIVAESGEEAQIAREVAEVLAPAEPRSIPVAVSGRHVHLDGATVAALFGPGYELTPDKPLRQPGNWAAAERVTVEGPQGRLERVAILGPLRNRTQVELSKTDCRALGLAAPVRDSGDLEGSARVRLIGPQGALETDGAIVAARHIHINPEDARALSLADGQVVDVRLGSGPRGLVLGGVRVRVQPGAFTEMHIDTDEANAAGLTAAADGALVAGLSAQTGAAGR